MGVGEEFGKGGEHTDIFVQRTSQFLGGDRQGRALACIGRPRSAPIGHDQREAP